MSMDWLELFRRNGLVSKDGKVAGALSPPTDPEAFKDALPPLLAEAMEQMVMVRVGVMNWHDPDYAEGPTEVLVYAVDLNRPNDQHGILKRLSWTMTSHGVRPLDFDIDSDDLWPLIESLVNQ
jgi:hypothetical protein